MREPERTKDDGHGVALSMTIRIPGSTRGPRVGDGVLAIANFVKMV
jgi:hypothetical protein